jgi:anti-sigma regulatory factor (Ser/Thr protein kinase)
MTDLTDPAYASGRQRKVCWELPADPEFVGKTRHMLAELLCSWAMAELIDDVTVVVSELYTNSLRHAAPPIRLTLLTDGRILHGSISDHGPMEWVATMSEPYADHGRGLAIVAALSARWGIDRLRGQARKSIWFTFVRGSA